MAIGSQKPGPPIQKVKAGEFKLDPTSKKILSTVNPDLQRVINRAAELTTTPFAVVSGNRTEEEQARLYGQGRPGFIWKGKAYGRPGMKITWTMNSNHRGGGAIDFSAIGPDGKPNNHDNRTWNERYYRPVAETILAAAKELGIKVYWPLWKKGDWGHISLRNG